MSGRTISGSYTTGVTLTSAGDSPLTILASASVANANGVALTAPAGVYWSIASVGRISGTSVGVSIAGAGSLVNAGTIAASQTTGAPGYAYNSTTKSFIPLSGGALLGGGGVSNASGGTIIGYFEGLALGGGGSLVNAGSIHAGSAGFGVVLTAGGSVDNATTGHIDGGRYGIFSLGTAAATVTNRGMIASAAATGVELLNGGTVTNTAGTISGATYGVEVGGATTSTVTNQGVITGQTKSGLVMFNGGSVSNAASAVIQGAVYGLAATGAAATLTNQGSISGGSATGVLLLDGGAVDAGATGTITGAYFGIRMTNAAGSVNNLGSVSSSRTFTGASTFDSAGVDLAAGGTVSNGVTGNIRSTWKGVEIGNIGASVGGTVLNQGTIFASNSAGNTGAAVWIHGPGLVSNAATGTIGGGPFGIVAYFQTTVVNYGSIGGTGFAVDAMPGFADRVIDEPGARFSGVVTGGNTIGSTIVSTLELASAATAGTIAGLGSQFIDFGAVQIDPGATWNITGANTLPVGATLSDQGTMLLGIATVTGGGAATIAGTGGGFAQATVSGLGAVWSGSTSIVVGDQGSGALLIANHGTMQTAGNAAVDPLQGFAVAESANAIGSVAVSGAGSLLGNTGRFVVGDAGLGSLSIEAGGTVITTAGTANLAGAVIGAQAGADGSSVRVVGAGSGFRVAGLLTVGNSAAGALALAAGGTVTADRLDVGALAGGSGNVSVVGKGSAVTVAGSLTIGDAASAELSILNGATVSAQNADIGLGATATGNVDIEGAGSHLNIANNLNIGDAGTGVLTLGSNTELTVVNALNVGANGVLNQFGGLIDPAVINNTGRVGGKGAIIATTSILNTGTLFASGGTETLTSPIITGAGALEIDAGGNLVLNVGSVAATQTATFTDSTGILTIGTLAGFSATIGDFLAGDAIVVQGVSVAATSFDTATHVLTLLDGAGTAEGTLHFAAAVTDGSAISVNGVTPCFVAGTRIGTERGEVAVEDLRPGERVQLVDRRGALPVVWLGRRQVVCTRQPEPHRVWPVRVAAHAFGPGRPARDLWLSPDHALYVNEVLIPVKHLINNSTITQIPVDEVTYYHVELPRHAVLLAEGLAAESYLDTGDRTNFANGGGAVALHPDFSSRAWEAQGCAPLVVAGAELTAVRRWLEVMAVAGSGFHPEPHWGSAPGPRQGRALGTHPVAPVRMMVSVQNG